MKVLFASWEVAPFFKVGGLGDVASSLPKALSSLEIDIRLIVPYYSAFKLHFQKRKKIKTFYVKYDNKRIKVNIYKIYFIDVKVPIYLLQNDKYLNFPDRHDTFAFFDLAISHILKHNYLSWMPEIVHCNEFHTGFIPLLIKQNKLPIKTLLTIHSLYHQGENSVDVINKMGIDPKKSRIIQWEIKKKKINFLLEGLIHADLVNTVSPSYAKEILTEEYGAGLDDILRGQEAKISGILNGIDYKSSNPSTDKNIKYHYHNGSDINKTQKTIYSITEGKRLNKAFLQEKVGFPVKKNIPLISFVGRFAGYQKGLDIMHKMLRRLDLTKYQFIFLGTGNKSWEERFLWLDSFYPKHVCCKFVFDERLASQIYAGSDFFLIPSKFEPCGLIQMIAMRYGTLPIARATGGLKDSIEDGVDGFLFEKYSSHSLERKLSQAIDIWKKDKPRYKQMVKIAMNKDFSWNVSAKQYIELYKKLLDNK